MVAIANFFNIYEDAAWHKDADAMIHLYAAQAVIFDMWDKGQVTNATEWATSIKDWLGGLGEEKVKVQFEQIAIHQSSDIGFATALIQFQAISAEDKVLRGMKNRITLGFSKFEDEWKVVHQHTSAPISSDGLIGILNI